MYEYLEGDQHYWLAHKENFKTFGTGWMLGSGRAVSLSE